MTSNISPWAFIQARREVACSYCGAHVGDACRRKSGALSDEPHTARTRAYRVKIGDTEFNRRHAKEND